MRRTLRLLLVAVLALVLAVLCRYIAARGKDHADAAAPRRARVATPFRGEWHGPTDRLTLQADPPASALAAVTMLPTASSGSSGTTTAPPDTILLHQDGLRSLDTACNAPPFGDAGIPVPFRGACFHVQMINGFDDAVLNAFVELLSLTYDGPTAGGTVVTYVKAPSDPVLGVDNTYGLWSYGLLTPAGTSGDRAEVNWYFYTTDPGAVARFHFFATAMGELRGPDAATHHDAGHP